MARVMECRKRSCPEDFFGSTFECPMRLSASSLSTIRLDQRSLTPGFPYSVSGHAQIAYTGFIRGGSIGPRDLGPPFLVSPSRRMACALMRTECQNQVWVSDLIGLPLSGQWPLAPRSAAPLNQSHAGTGRGHDGCSCAPPRQNDGDLQRPDRR